MKRNAASNIGVLSALYASILIPACIEACSGATSIAPPDAASAGSDGGANDAGPVDQAANDAVAPGDGGVRADSGGPGETQTLVLAGDVDLVGVTAAGDALYIDNATHSLRVLPVAATGDSKVLVANVPAGTSPAVVTAGSVAFFGVSETTDGGASTSLSVWSSTTGITKLSENASIISVPPVASDDGHYVFYLAYGASATDSNPYIAVRDLRTGVESAIAPHLDLEGGCKPQLEGPIGSNIVFVACVDSLRASTLHAYDMDHGTTRSLGGMDYAYSSFVLDKSNTHIAYFVQRNTAQGIAGQYISVVSLADGTTTYFGEATGSFALSDDGTQVAYGKAGGGNFIAPVTNPAAAVRLPEEFGSVALFSPDARSALTYRQQTFPSPFGIGPDGGPADESFSLSDVYLSKLPAVDGGTTPLLTTVTGAIDKFTANGAFALFYADFQTSWTGTLTAAPVAGGTPRVLGRNVSASLALHDGIVVFDDNQAGPAKRAYGSTADIEMVDLATSATATTIARSVSIGSFYAAKAQRVFYSAKSPTAGIFAVRLP